MIAAFTSVRYHLRTITVLKLSNHCLILLFTPLLSVRGETSYKLKIILLLSLNELNLAVIQKNAYSCLRIILPLSYYAHTPLLYVRGETTYLHLTEILD